MIRSAPHADPPDADGTHGDTAPTGTRRTASSADAPRHPPRAPQHADYSEYGDPIDQASDDSFPASDPPPWTLGLRRAPVVVEPVDNT